mgnify:CR=1 FL=1
MRNLVLNGSLPGQACAQTCACQCSKDRGANHGAWITHRAAHGLARETPVAQERGRLPGHNRHEQKAGV